MEPTVFVVDDDQDWRDSLRFLFSTRRIRTEVFPSGEEFLRHVEPSRTGCAIIDLRMKGMSGVELQQQMCDRCYSLPSIVVSAYADVPTTVMLMRQGALTVLEKPLEDGVLWNSVQQALELSQGRRNKMGLEASVRARMEGLTEQEREVMVSIVKGESNKAVAERLHVGLRTVEARRASIFRKMKAGSLAHLVRLTSYLGDSPNDD